jgi:hypothetical protein
MARLIHRFPAAILIVTEHDRDPLGRDDHWTGNNAR